jgi:hypothetical protein
VLYNSICSFHSFRCRGICAITTQRTCFSHHIHNQTQSCKLCMLGLLSNCCCCLLLLSIHTYTSCISSSSCGLVQVQLVYSYLSTSVCTLYQAQHFSEHMHIQTHTHVGHMQTHTRSWLSYTITSVYLCIRFISYRKHSYYAYL